MRLRRSQDTDLVTWALDGAEDHLLDGKIQGIWERDEILEWRKQCVDSVSGAAVQLLSSVSELIK